MPRDLLPLVQEALDGKYTVEREIGRGGAARVFLAHTNTGDPVALKVLHPELQVSLMADRFLREIRLVSSIDHPRIARVLDWGQHDWLVYYVMPFIEGMSLRRALDRVSQLTVDDTIRIGADLLDALEHAHAHGIMHRDVKPDNVIVSPGGAVLVDFGVARAVEVSVTDRVTRSGVTVGTAAYMSPEQVSAAIDLDHRSDLYAVGCVLFECLAGRPPFTHRSENILLQLHLSEVAPDVRSYRADAPGPVAEAISRALLKPRDERWQTAGEMRDALGE